MRARSKGLRGWVYDFTFNKRMLLLGAEAGFDGLLSCLLLQ